VNFSQISKKPQKEKYPTPIAKSMI